MFTNLLPSSNNLFSVTYSKYAESHYLKSFTKDYKGKQWEKTDLSIKFDLARLRLPNNTTQRSQQVDELKHKGQYWLFKYDFRVAGTNLSTKASGNRCVCFIDNSSNKLEILLIYAKTHLPKNKPETMFIYDVLKDEYPSYFKLFE